MDHKPYEGQVPTPKLWQGIRPCCFCPENPSVYVDGVFSSVVSKIQVEVVIFVSKMMCFFLGCFFLKNPLSKIRMIAKREVFLVPFHFKPTRIWRLQFHTTAGHWVPTLRSTMATTLSQHQSSMGQIFQPYLIYINVFLENRHQWASMDGFTLISTI